MGEYFCDTCKFYDDDVSLKFLFLLLCFESFCQTDSFVLSKTEKRQYHCYDCGICR